MRLIKCSRRFLDKILRVNPDDVAKLRRSYRWLAYGRLNVGGKISQDLLGTDRKADEDGLYQKAEDWIHEKD